MEPPPHKWIRHAFTTSRPSSPRLLSILTVLVAAGAAVLGSVSAGLAASRPSSQELQARLAQLNDQAERITEQYNGERVALSNAEQAAARAQRALDSQRRHVAQARGQVATLAAQRYITEGVDPVVAMLGTGDPQQVIDRAATAQQLTEQQAGRLQDLARTERGYARAQRNAAQHAAQIRRLTEEIAGKKARIERLVAQIEEQLRESRRPEAGGAPTSGTASSSSRTTPVTTPSVAIKGSGKAFGAVRAALSKLGAPYVWGAAGPNAFDCSGLVMWAYKQVGIDLPHYTGAQWNAGRHVSRDELKPGDLVFFYPDLHHVGLYVGDGKMVNAPHTGDVVKIAPIAGRPYAGAVRVVG